MSDHEKLNRLLRVIILMSGPVRYTRSELAEKLNITERTLYRYFETFRKAGLEIDYEDGKCWLVKEAYSIKDLSELLHFSEEESYVLNKAIYSIDEQSAIKENLVRKLRTLYSSRKFADTLIQDHLGKNIGILTDAIESKRQVVLYKYRSANTGKITDRTVEPFKFTTNHISVWCFDVDKKQNRLFKTARIGTAELNGKRWLYEGQHHSTETDIFRIGAIERIPVCIKLSMRARNLLCEEYPLAEKYVQDNGKGEYIFDHWVANFKGIGRFVLGLLDEVEVIAPKDFKDYLNGKLKNNRFD